ncbi:MAG TPA: 6-carboxytetrahydropterin synthase [Phycisphaerae bacterium]|jgi:6-pyruvoyltetrahydropterin/6-carboxytetrahydropterin synthase
MYRVTVEASFSAAHRLWLADGSYEPVHGHDWYVTARYAGQRLNAQGLLVDFIQLRTALRDVVRLLDHTDLNANPLLAGRNPSAECVAQAIYENLATAPGGALLTSVRVTEEPGCAAEYLRDE